MGRMRRLTLAGVALLLLPGVAAAQVDRSWNARTPWNDLRPNIARGDWEAQKKEPFQIFDNVYYVGLQQYSAFLITTSVGLVLLDATYAETAENVLDNIRTLGFDPADIVYTFISHGHGDHYAGAARVKQVSGSRVGMTRADWELVEERERQRDTSGSRLTRDLVIGQGDIIEIGDASFKFHVTPGHTPGCLTIEYIVYDDGQPYRAISPGGLGLVFGPEWTAPYLDSLARMRALEPDVILPNHPYMGTGHLFAQADALAARETGGPNPFASREAVESWFDALETVARAKLDAEKEP